MEGFGRPSKELVEKFRTIPTAIVSDNMHRIFAGGTGNPFFTTDTAAALRAVEIEAGGVLKGTHSGTDGIYTADPRLDPEATLLEQVSHLDVIQMGLRAMDATAVTLCMENDLPIVMFDLMTPGNVRSILAGESVGTLVA